jgi:squalene synthase HpnC
VRPPLDAAAADAYCGELAGRHYENFTVASKILQAGLRRDLARIYAYARTTDDLGDESARDARGRLEEWRRAVLDLFAGSEPSHPVLLALRDTIGRCALPAQPFLDLIDANVQDQEVSRYATWTDLRAYCMLSAAPVGRLVLRVFGVTAPQAEPLSDDVCIGLQIANFAQDVRVDAGKGRSYLLQTEIETGGVAGATRGHCDRARRLLDSGRQLETMVPWTLRVQLALYRLGGLAIVEAVERLGYRTDLERPQVSGPARVLVLARALRQSLRRSRDAGAVAAA